MTRILLIYSKKNSVNALTSTLDKSDCELVTASAHDDIWRVATNHNISLVIWSVNSPDKEIDTQKLSPEEALQQLAANARTQFDPFLVMKLIDVIEEKVILGDNIKDLENTRKIIQKSCPP